MEWLADSSSVNSKSGGVHSFTTSISTSFVKYNCGASSITTSYSEVPRAQYYFEKDLRWLRPTDPSKNLMLTLRGGLYITVIIKFWYSIRIYFVSNRIYLKLCLSKKEILAGTKHQRQRMIHIQEKMRLVTSECIARNESIPFQRKQLKINNFCDVCRTEQSLQCSSISLRKWGWR